VAGVAPEEEDGPRVFTIEAMDVAFVLLSEVSELTVGSIVSDEESLDVCTVKGHGCGCHGSGTSLHAG